MHWRIVLCFHDEANTLESACELQVGLQQVFVLCRFRGLVSMAEARTLVRTDEI